MSIFGDLWRAACALVATLVLATSPALGAERRPIADVSPGPATRIPASSAKFVQFHILARPQPGESVTAAFQWNGAKIDSGGPSCRIAFAATSGHVTQRTPANAPCSLSPKAVAITRADGSMDVTVPLAFSKPGRYTLHIHTPSSGWTPLGEYQMTSDASTSLGISLVGATHTQAILSFTPPAGAGPCQVQVTATQNTSGWDYSLLVPDTDPNIFAGADNAELYDPDSGPQNRGYTMPDGSRALVIGKRAAEYSQYTYRTHSRALQAATPHEAWITCGAASGTIDFTTANLMTGSGYLEPLPADPNRPGDYAYPTLSWTDRRDGAVDPQTGVMIRPITFPPDSYLDPNLSDWVGQFGSPVPVFPSRNLPAKSIFLPANLTKTVNTFSFEISAAHPGWGQSEASLASFLPTALALSCPLCNNSVITVCLTTDGASCAYDRNVIADPNATLDPNTGQKAILGAAFNCSSNCQLDLSGARWKDATPVLAAWHPNYTQGAPNTVLPNFQFDSAKPRYMTISCDGSTLVSRAKDIYGSWLGPAFNTDWTPGTPLVVDATSQPLTVAKMRDENTLIANESCPASAKSMTVNNFGLLISAPYPISRIVPDVWRAKVSDPSTSWDAGGSMETFTNCSRQPVFVSGQKGWHCVLGGSLYWIAADASLSLPMGAAGLAYRPDIPHGYYCGLALWDNADPNSLLCTFISPQGGGGRTAIVQLTFFGDHSGLENAQFTLPDADSVRAYLPVCKSTNPPSPNNCMRITPLTATGTNNLFLLEDAIAAAMPDAWKNSPFAAAMQDSAVYSISNYKLDDNHLLFTTRLSQDAVGFSSVVEFSTPRGSAKVRAVTASWGPAGSKTTNPMRWSGIHDTSSNPWGPTKASLAPTLALCCGTVERYASAVVKTDPAKCPQNTSGNCLAITVDGQPGIKNPSKYEPRNDAKTRKPGYGYLTDIAPGDLLCAPLNNDIYNCIYLTVFNRFELFRVLSTDTNSDGTVVVTTQRNVFNTTTWTFPPGQQVFMMPAQCSNTDGSGCFIAPTVWDWATDSIERVETSGSGHQFTNYDPATQQVINISAVAVKLGDPLCYDHGIYYGNCYSYFGGKLDPNQSVNSQIASLFGGLLSTNPPFGVGTATQGETGRGIPNDVESHPAMNQLPAAPDSEKVWFVDGRPFAGAIYPSVGPQPVSGDIYRFPASSDAIYAGFAESNVAADLERYKRLPMIASCGLNPLREVVQISNQTPYTYCVAVGGGDCMSGSVKGEIYLNCPAVNPQARPDAPCPYAGIASYTPEVRDTCLALSGANVLGLTQTGFASQAKGIWTPLPYERRFRSTRMLTRGLSRYRVVDEFLNAKTTPDGGVLLFRTLYASGYSTRIMMAKIPPFPDLLNDTVDRRRFIPTPAILDPAPAGTTSVKVQYGYNSNYNCVARPEACEARVDYDPSGTSTPFYFASEGGPTGFDCTNGCPASVNLSGVAQRVVFYRPVYQVNGSPVYGTPHVTLVPDLPGN